MSFNLRFVDNIEIDHKPTIMITFSDLHSSNENFQRLYSSKYFSFGTVLVPELFLFN